MSTHRTPNTAVGQVVTLMVTMVVRQGCLEPFRAALSRNAWGSRAELGCLRFDMYRSLEEDRQFFLHEQYQDKHALASHRSSAHYQRWDAEVDALVEPGSRVVNASSKVDI
jgi:quinol monooxygenase YgiN